MYILYELKKTGHTSAVFCFGSPAIFFPKEAYSLSMEKTRRFPYPPHSEFGFIGYFIFNYIRLIYCVTPRQHPLIL